MKNCILGIDTSNYTTSAALINADNNEVVSSLKKLLPVKAGERGLRQSDAVFHHTLALPQILKELYEDKDIHTLAVAVSEKPCGQEGSYMPCFAAGINAAGAVSSALNIPLFKTTHQTGHILSCLIGAKKTELINNDFLCYHVSGGTTQALLVTADEDVIKAAPVAESTDLNAGQAVDRIGVKLGLNFPAGAELEKFALKSKKSYGRKAHFVNNNFSLSGLENLAYKMLQEGEDKCDAAKFCFDFIANTLVECTKRLYALYGEIPLCFAGGVMSNGIIKNEILKNFNAYFCPPELSTDNAVGVAYYGSRMYKKWKN